MDLTVSDLLGSDEKHLNTTSPLYFFNFFYHICYLVSFTFYFFISHILSQLGTRFRLMDGRRRMDE